MLKTIFAKIAHGLLVGIGFGLALGVAMYGYTQWQMRQFSERKTEMFGIKEYGADARLSIKEHRPQKENNNDAFIGTLSNDGNDSWQSVELVVEMFDKDGKFVDKCSSYLDGSIAPGETRNFKVSCAGCRNNSIPLVYEKYKISIIDANYALTKKQG